VRRAAAVAAAVLSFRSPLARARARAPFLLSFVVLEAVAVMLVCREAVLGIGGRKG
jgi:hypothetical protein